MKLSNGIKILKHGKIIIDNKHMGIIGFEYDCKDCKQGSFQDVWPELIERYIKGE